MDSVRALGLAALLVLWPVASRAADPPRRPPAGGLQEPVLEDGPDRGDDGDDDTDTEPGDEDLDQRGTPPEAAPRAPLRPVPPADQEEIPAPSESSPVRTGPAEPASAAQPLAPG
jgi:hypothetical protein